MVLARFVSEMLIVGEGGEEGGEYVGERGVYLIRRGDTSWSQSDSSDESSGGSKAVICSQH